MNIQPGSPSEEGKKQAAYDFGQAFGRAWGLENPQVVLAGQGIDSALTITEGLGGPADGQTALDAEHQPLLHKSHTQIILDLPVIQEGTLIGGFVRSFQVGDLTVEFGQTPGWDACGNCHEKGQGAVLKIQRVNPENGERETLQGRSLGYRLDRREFGEHVDLAAQQWKRVTEARRQAAQELGLNRMEGDQSPGGPYWPLYARFRAGTGTITKVSDGAWSAPSTLPLNGPLIHWPESVKNACAYY